MATELEFRPYDEILYSIYETWFSDIELAKRYNQPTPAWLNYVRNTPGVYAWLIFENQNAIGSIQLDSGEKGIGYVGFVVKPDLRNQGFGKRILKSLLNRPEAQTFKTIIGEAEEDNVASRRCLESVGFLHNISIPTEKGFVVYVFDIIPATP